MLELITVSTKGQIVIPENLRKRLKIEPGTKFILIEKNGDIILKKEETIISYLEHDERKETEGWLALAEQSLKDLWDNPKDEKTWKKYL